MCLKMLYLRRSPIPGKAAEFSIVVQMVNDWSTNEICPMSLAMVVSADNQHVTPAASPHVRDRCTEAIRISVIMIREMANRKNDTKHCDPGASE